MDDQDVNKESELGLNPSDSKELEQIADDFFDQLSELHNDVLVMHEDGRHTLGDEEIAKPKSSPSR